MATGTGKNSPLQASLRQVRFFSANPACGSICLARARSLRPSGHLRCASSRMPKALGCAHPSYLTRCAHPFRAAFGTLSRFARLWVIPSRPLPSSGLARNKLVAEAFYLTGSIEKYGSGFIRIRKALEDYPEVRLEISESAHGLMLSFLKVAPQPESQQVTDQVTDEVLRLVSVIRGQMSRSEIQVLLGLRHLPHLRNAYLKPAIQHGLLEMTIPDKPQSRLQKYRLTPAGKTLAERIKAKK